MQVRTRSGDTLWYYSQLFQIPFHLLIDSNPEFNPNQLAVGQTVQIPGFTTQTYTVKDGDTFWRLATRRNLTVDALLLLNQNQNPTQLVIGQSVILPQRVITPVMNRQTLYDISTLTNDLNVLRQVYPFIRIETVGQSVLGKPIQEIRIGRGAKKVHLNASFHANEWITSAILMACLNTFLLSLTNGNSIRELSPLPLYEAAELSIVPMVDPDGVDLVLKGPPSNMREEIIRINKGSANFTGWKANIRGVDLNNQFPAKWELEKERTKEKAPAPRDYPGESPLSEPETIAMARLAQERQFDRLLAIHTQGEEFYWGYEGMEPSESSLLAQEFERISGYKSVRYIDSYAGYKDWFIQEFRRPGFTIELGLGTNPLPLSQFDEIYEEFLGIFLASIYI
ncbi:M14 family metallopeptidase [Robertmurraya kyonggiensis]|uniref:LysM peptidoglycan-binding domain-containing protein n=1 Tax=Robertmurraya kyonggiensis TaxID=1037680 RepID=A0A4U1DD05_9BACI|nr:M14 family metallopeptidase [Robertmurraya kyonggiensis]TKC19903.1 LysM peptidoglycan-binding domain-containing protein [Robertmurraya kyonggiensis]